MIVILKEYLIIVPGLLPLRDVDFVPETVQMALLLEVKDHSMSGSGASI